MSSGPVSSELVGSELVHLRAAGTSLLLDLRDGGLPHVIHFGADLGELDPGQLVAVADAVVPAVANSALERSVPVRLVPERADGWRGRPGLDGWRGREVEDAPDAESGWSPSFRLEPGGVTLRACGVGVSARDEVAGLQLSCELDLHPSGVLQSRYSLTNIGAGSYHLERLACLVLPVGAQATELLDLTGRWCRERHPQRHPLAQGTWSREGRHGRTGHDATLVLVAGVPGFGDRHGEVWGLHLGWSGDHATWAERLPDGHTTLGAAELLNPGEVALSAGETYAAPPAFAVHSSDGLDGISRAFHAYLRARPGHPVRPRPVVLNTWEAVYFDHRLDRLTALADTAAGLGVERFVLDDGWFRHRRDDTAGLGDWFVDEAVWPRGLEPLVGHVRGLGLEFGLWVEPEMVNLDSDLFRAHPDWILQAEGRMPPPWRHQQVLDLARPEVSAYLLERLDDVLTDLDISYLKWDHNRDLVEPGHRGRPGVAPHTRAVYRLLDELRARHPGVEIESCSSGGGRVDLGALARTDRVWASDTNDALERATIQRWTQLLLPPELVGSHIGPPRSHTTSRTHDLTFRFAVALFGHFGLEWDVNAATDAERTALTNGIAFYKQVRELLHHGDVVHAEVGDPAAAVHGVVSADRRQALFAYLQTSTSVAEVPGPVRLPGLDDDLTYRVRPVHPTGEPHQGGRRPPPWYAAGSVQLPGRVLNATGLAVPVLHPEQALLLQVDAIGAAGPRP